LNFEKVLTMVDDHTRSIRELELLEQIEEDPDINQATLAEKLGIAVGTVNWHIKRLISKGYLKATRAQRKKLRYVLTPEGLSLRAKLTIKYVENQMRLYRETRKRVKEILESLEKQGHHQIQILGEGEIADVCQLTCLEMGFEVVDDQQVPVLNIEGYKVFLDERDHQ
jgi:DNA-binding MarR family transcriptional regulator